MSTRCSFTIICNCKTSLPTRHYRLRCFDLRWLNQKAVAAFNDTAGLTPRPAAPNRGVVQLSRADFACVQHEPCSGVVPRSGLVLSFFCSSLLDSIQNWKSVRFCPKVSESVPKVLTVATPSRYWYPTGPVDMFRSRGPRPRSLRTPKLSPAGCSRLRHEACSEPRPGLISSVCGN